MIGAVIIGASTGFVLAALWCTVEDHYNTSRRGDGHTIAIVALFTVAGAVIGSAFFAEIAKNGAAL